MTVKELIEILQTFDDSKSVMIQSECSFHDLDKDEIKLTEIYKHNDDRHWYESYYSHKLSDVENVREVVTLNYG